MLRDDYGVSDDAWIKDRLITSKDYASVQIVIADVDANGRALQTSTSFALSGQVRAQGEGDDSLNRLATQAGCKHELLSSTVITRVDHFMPSSTPSRVELLKMIWRPFFWDLYSLVCSTFTRFISHVCTSRRTSRRCRVISGPDSGRRSRSKSN